MRFTTNSQYESFFYGWINLYDVPKALLFVFVYRNFTTNSLDSFHYKPKTYIHTN